MKKINKRKKVKKTIITIIIIFLAFIFSIFIYQKYTSIEIDNTKYQAKRTQSTEDEQTVENVEQKSKNITDIIEQTTNAVVGISKLQNAGATILTNSSEEDLGLGTGAVVTSNGYILSNEHVTGSKYSKCYITLEDGKNYDGTVVWSDSDLDLSLTKIKAENLNYVTLGESDNIKVGQTVYAIGNPIGLEFRRTVTSGIISAKNRTIKIEEENKISYMSDLIQTDATINPGNSGGPLIYPNGQVIGITTVKITTAEGIGFAIPIDVIKKVIDSFKNTDNFEEATIGIYAYDWTATKYLNSDNLLRNKYFRKRYICRSSNKKWTSKQFWIKGRRYNKKYR